MDKWISVKERLPERNMPVWVTCYHEDNSRYVWDAHYLVDGDIDADEGPGFYFECGEEAPEYDKLNNVVAWMPNEVPDAYTGD